MIKALKEDWTTNKTLKAYKNKEEIKRRKEVKQKLQALESTIEKLNKQKELVKAPIFKDLLSSDDVFKTVYNAAIEGLGDFMLQHIARTKHLPIRERYTKEMTIQVGMHAELLKQYPDRFKKTQEIEEQIKSAQKEIAVLKKSNRWL